MCNIAGYVGTRQAGPILNDMFRRQEGWDCGHYVGMATVDGGSLYVEKDVGNLDMFLAGHDAYAMPGTVGVIHGRTPGKPGQINEHWAHPFVGSKGRFAMVVNGCGGKFAQTIPPKNRLAYQQLREEGYEFESLTEEGTPGKGQMPDGLFVHPTEIKCQRVQQRVDQGMSLTEACSAVSIELPGERVSLIVNADEPECIIWSRINYPMFVAYADHGMYLATTPQAMPEDARNVTLLMACASGKVYKDHIETVPYKAPGFTVAPITPQVWKKAYEAMEAALTENEMHHDHLDRLLQPLFDEATCVPESAVNYAIMDYWERQGRLSVIKSYCPGTAPDSVAPRLTAKLK